MSNKESARFDIWRFHPPRCQLKTCFVAPAASSGSHINFLLWVLQSSHSSLRALELPDAVQEEETAALSGLATLHHLSRPHRQGSTMDWRIPDVKSLAIYSYYSPVRLASQLLPCRLIARQASALTGYGESLCWIRLLMANLEAKTLHLESFAVVCQPPFVEGTSRYTRFLEMWHKDCAEAARFCAQHSIRFESFLLPSTCQRFPSYFEISSQIETLGQCAVSQSISLLAH